MGRASMVTAPAMLSVCDGKQCIGFAFSRGPRGEIAGALPDQRGGNRRGDRCATCRVKVLNRDGGRRMTKGIPVADSNRPALVDDNPMTLLNHSSPTCVVTFADGEITRMTTWSSNGKPDLRRGIRLAHAAYESRTIPRAGDRA